MSQLVDDALALLAALDVEADHRRRWQGGRGGCPAGLGRRAGRGAGGGIGRHRRAVADRPEGRPGPDDLDRRPRVPAYPQVRENRQDGFKAHMVVEPDTGLTTAAALTKTNGRDNSDATVGGQLLDTDPTIARDGHGRRPASRAGRTFRVTSSGPTARTEVLGDSAYGTGDLLDKINKAGWTAMIKPHPLRPAVEGGFTVGRLHL